MDCKYRIRTVKVCVIAGAGPGQLAASGYQAARTALRDTVITIGVLGHRRLMDFGVAIGYGTDKPDFWISGGEAAAGPNRETHIAFSAPSAAVVREWYAAAMELGAESLHEPRLWPEYHERYYGAFVRDPDGNNVEAVCHTAGPED